MASAKLQKKSSDKFLSPEQSRTIKPGDFKHHTKLKDLSQDDLIDLLSLMEAELQAKDILLKAILSNQAGVALPLSHLLDDGISSKLVDTNITNKGTVNEEDDEEEIWLGEPSAHLNHVVAYHQVVREQMQEIVKSLQKQHKQVVDQLEEERQKHAADTAQGDDVTYMLEKQRELLKHQIDLEQAKYADLEKERDNLLLMIEKERSEQYNTFNSLINDCKAFALQLVQQSTKYQKEIEKEKQKNKVLSELMVEETQKLKEKLKQHEDQVNEFQLLDRKKTDIEEKLRTMEKKYRETFRQLDEERLTNRKLNLHINQLQKHLPPDYNRCEEDILYVQDKVEIPFKQAGISSITVSNREERDSPEPFNIPPTTPHLQPVKIATVQKSSCVKQGTSSQISSKLPISPKIQSHISTPNNLAIHPSNVNIDYSGEERRALDLPQDKQPTQMRNSYENISHVTNNDFTHVGGSVRTSSNTTTMRHNSCEEVRYIGVGAISVEPKRNSYEGESSTKKTPPPAPPPRRGSTLSSTEKAPVIKVPNVYQPRRTLPPSNIPYQQLKHGPNSSGNESGPRL